jgi:hypothetical protein
MEVENSQLNRISLIGILSLTFDDIGCFSMFSINQGRREA